MADEAAIQQPTMVGVPGSRVEGFEHGCWAVWPFNFQILIPHVMKKCRTHVSLPVLR